MIRLMLCQNDDNGNLTNELTCVTIDVYGEHCATFEPVDLLPKKCICNSHVIEIQRMRVKYNSVIEWAGSMSYNLYNFQVEYALGFIQMLQQTKQWHCTEGWDKVFKKFNNNELITGKDFDLDQDYQPTILNPNQLTLLL